MNTDISPEQLGCTWDKLIDKKVKEYIEETYTDSDLAEFIIAKYPEAVTDYKEALREDAEESVDKQECFTEACAYHDIDPEIASAWY